MDRKRVLIITYYWPPSGGAGVQRVLKAVKYLRSFGWEPIVCTAADAAYPVIDEGLMDEVPADIEVLKTPIWEPYEIYKRFTGQNKKERVYSGFMNQGEKQSFSQRMSVWLRGNLFIPDARAFWIRPAVHYLRKWLKSHKVDAILSTGPPHSAHLIARQIKGSHNIPWLVDFRDPWTNIDFYDQLKLSKWADKIHHSLEQSVLKEADKVVTVTWSWAEDFRNLGREEVIVITNGYDPADFPAEMPPSEKPFTICHVGSINQDRNSPLLWKVLRKLKAELPGFSESLRLRFVGKTDQVVFQQLEKEGLVENMEDVGYVPHSQVIDQLAAARVLLLLTNDTPNAMGIIPGKLYEYMAADRPILAIGNTKGDSARVLEETNSGVMCGFGDEDKMEDEIRELFKSWKEGSSRFTRNEKAIQKYSRKIATQQLADQLNIITQNQPL